MALCTEYVKKNNMQYVEFYMQLNYQITESLVSYFRKFTIETLALKEFFQGVFQKEEK
jgi:hypothetical protein